MTKKKSVFAVVASAALVLGAVLTLLSPARALTNCSVSAADQAVDAEEQQMLALINEFRQALGLSPLSLDPTVTRAAAWMSRDMATNNRFSHVDSLGRNEVTRLNQCDVPWVRLAENLAAGNDSAEETFQQWVASPPHNANMRLPDVTLAGIARAFNEASTFDWYWTLNLTNPGSGATTTAPPGSTTSTTSGTPTSTTTTSTLPGGPTTTIPGPTTTIPGTFPFPTFPFPFPTLPTTTTIPTGTTVPTSTTTTSTSTRVPLPTSTIVPLPSSSALCDQLDELRSTFDASFDETFDEMESLVRRELSGAQEEAFLALLARHRGSDGDPFDGFEAFCNPEAVA